MFWSILIKTSWFPLKRNQRVSNEVNASIIGALISYHHNQLGCAFAQTSKSPLNVNKRNIQHGKGMLATCTQHVHASYMYTIHACSMLNSTNLRHSQPDARSIFIPCFQYDSTQVLMMSHSKNTGYTFSMMGGSFFEV